MGHMQGKRKYGAQYISKSLEESIPENTSAASLRGYIFSLSALLPLTILFESVIMKHLFLSPIF